MLSAIVDVAIGIILVYLILSVMASATAELLSNVFQWRAKKLELFIEQLFVAPPPTTERDIAWFLHATAETLKDLIMPHKSIPQVSDLYNKTIIAPQMQRGLKPSYINSEDFAQAVFNLLFSEAPTSTPTTPTATPTPTQSDPKDVRQALQDPSKFANTPLRLVLLRAVEQAEDDLAMIPAISQRVSTYKQVLEDLASSQDTIAKLPESPLKDSINSVISGAKADFAHIREVNARVREYLENWYDNSMERVAGWYKGQTQIVLLALGLLIAIVFNVDTLAIANHLFQDPTLRAAIADQADVIAKSIASSAGTIVNPTPIAATPAAPTPEPNGTVTPGPTESATPTAAQSASIIYQLQGDLKQLNFPIGWGDPANVPTDPWGILEKIIGILITAFAVSQGAPFWFDLLNKITNLRSAGKSPEKANPTPPESSSGG